MTEVRQPTSSSDNITLLSTGIQRQRQEDPEKDRACSYTFFAQSKHSAATTATTRPRPAQPSTEDSLARPDASGSLRLVTTAGSRGKRQPPFHLDGCGHPNLGRIASYDVRDGPFPEMSIPVHPELDLSWAGGCLARWTVGCSAEMPVKPSRAGPPGQMNWKRGRFFFFSNLLRFPSTWHHGFLLSGFHCR